MRAALHAVWRGKYYVATTAFWLTTVPIFINDHIAEINQVEGASMSPSISPSYHETRRCDHILWNKSSPSENIKRGDVVHFMNPVKPDYFAVKRVIALEGDEVVLDKRRRPSIQQGSEPPEAQAWDAWRGKATVPEGHVWVEGDNWRSSRDSNWYGPISKALINGKAVGVVWPPSRFWTAPWEEFKTRTKVIEGQVTQSWEDGLPIELAEIRGPHLPR